MADQDDGGKHLDILSGLWLHTLLASYLETAISNPGVAQLGPDGKPRECRVMAAQLPIVRDAVEQGMREDVQQAFSAYAVACVGATRLLGMAQRAVYLAGGEAAVHAFLDEIEDAGEASCAQADADEQAARVKAQRTN